MNTINRGLKTLTFYFILLFAISIAYAAPAANAGADKSINVGNTASFSGSGSSCASCSITSYNWDFGDGESASGISTTHTYSSAGSYTATLVVVSNLGEVDSDTATVTVNTLDATDPVINHTNVTSASINSGVLVSATITDNIAVTNAYVYYKNNSDSSYTQASLSASGDTFTYTIPSTKFQTGGVNFYYYLSATDGSNTAKYPTGAPNSDNISVSVASSDNVPPTTSLVSVAGDTSSPYWDKTNNSQTAIKVLGETGMTCRYSTTSQNYSSMSSTKGCTVSGSQATCNINITSDSATNTRYVGCADSSSNGQNSSQILTVTFGTDFTAPAISAFDVDFNASQRTVVLNWTTPSDGTSGMSSIKIYVSTTSGSLGSLNTTMAGNSTSYTYTGIDNQSVYYYTFKALDIAGNIFTSDQYQNMPKITSATASESTTSATLSVTTDTDASCRYSTNSSKNYTGMAAGQFNGNGTTSHSASVTGLTTSTTYSYYILCIDNESNVMSNATNLTFTTTDSSTTTTAGGSSGGGGSTDTSSDPEGQIYTKLWPTVARGQTITMAVARTDIPITELDITMGIDKDDLSVRVSEMNSRPSSVSALDKSYKYMKIITNTVSNGVSSAKIKFSVPVSWFTNNGLSENDVALYRYFDDAWTELTTKVIGIEGNNINFEAITPGFSYFAIAKKTQSTVTTTLLDGSVTTTQSGVTTTQSGVTTTQSDVTITQESTTTTISSGSGGVKPGVIAIIVVAILAVIAVVVTMTRKKRDQFDF